MCIRLLKVIKLKKRINRRKKGSVFEYKVRDYLKELGCFVTRSTVSRFPDLIAITPLVDQIELSENKGNNPAIWAEPGVWFVECKSNKYLNRKEKKALKELRQKYDIVPFVAYPRYSVYSKKKDNIILEEVK